MPMYNAAAYVEASILSVLAQTYTHWQLLIVDDASTDHGVALVEKFSDDARIKLLKNNVNSGAVLSRNKAIEAATGDIIAFLDSDDVWYTDKLAKQINEYQRYPQTAMVFCNYEHMDAQGKPLGKVLTSPALVDYATLLKTNLHRLFNRHL